MNIVIETVTPKLAEAWLNANKSNRRLREGVVERYAEDMRQGRWTNCPEPISFYADGDLADGQHRLWAIVESGQAQNFPIARNLSRQDGLNLNTGFTRTVLDNARISGSDAALSPALISAARAIEYGTMAVGRALSNAEILAMVDRHREAAAFAASTVRRKQLLCGATILGAVGRAYLHELNHDRLRRFCDVLATGFYEGPGETAAVTLRNYMLAKGATASSSALWRDTFFKSQNAIYYFMRERKLTTIKGVAEEAYPPLEKPRAPPARRPAKPAASATRAKAAA